MKFLLTLLSLPEIAQTRDTIRIATYNILNYTGQSVNDRQFDYISILTELDADILSSSQSLPGSY
jgi:hypothetical protein